MSEEVKETIETKEEKEIETVDKKLLDKALKDKAELSRRLKEKQTEDEKALEAQAEVERELEELRNFKRKSTLENALLKDGKIPSDDVTSICDAVLSGDVTKVAETINKMVGNVSDELTKTFKREQLNGTLRPEGSADDKELTTTDFKKMTLDERTDLKISNPELYNKLKG